MDDIKFFDFEKIYEKNDKSLIFRKKKNIFITYKIYSTGWFREINFMKYSHVMFEKYKLRRYLKYIRILPLSPVSFDFYNDFYVLNGRMIFSAEKIEYVTYNADLMWQVKKINRFYLFRTLREFLFVLAFLNRCSVIHKDMSERSLLCSTIFCFYKKLYLTDSRMEMLISNRVSKMITKLDNSVLSSFGNLVYQLITGINSLDMAGEDILLDFTARYGHKKSKKYEFCYRVLCLCFSSDAQTFDEIFFRCKNYYDKKYVDLINSVKIPHFKTIHLENTKEYIDCAAVSKYAVDNKIMYFFNNLYKRVDFAEMTEEYLFIIYCAVHILYSSDIDFFRENAEEYRKKTGRIIRKDFIQEKIKELFIRLDKSILCILFDVL